MTYGDYWAEVTIVYGFRLDEAMLKKLNSLKVPRYIKIYYKYHAGEFKVGICGIDIVRHSEATSKLYGRLKIVNTCKINARIEEIAPKLKKFCRVNNLKFMRKPKVYLWPDSFD